MSLPLALPPAVSPKGFAPETRWLLRQLPRRPGLWVLTETRPAEAQVARRAAVPYPSGGHTQAARMAHYFLLGALVRGERALFLDAANCFNPHKLAAMAARLNEMRAALRPRGYGGCPAEELLGRVHLSRAFTCFQLAELVERVPAAARRLGARCVFLTGVPEIFDDEELNATEARRVFARALAGMRRWRSLQFSALVFTAVLTPLRAPPRWLAAQLERAADGVFRFEETPDGLAVQGRTVTSPARLRPSPLLRQAFLLVPSEAEGPVHHGRKPVA